MNGPPPAFVRRPIDCEGLVLVVDDHPQVTLKCIQIDVAINRNLFG